MNCPTCESNEVIKKGTVVLSTGTIKQRYKCKSCDAPFSITMNDDATEDLFADEFEQDVVLDQTTYDRPESWLGSNIYNRKRIIITSAQNNTEVNASFLKCIQSYQKANDAGLIVIPIKYKTINREDDESVCVYDDRIVPYLCENTIEFPKHNVKIYAGLKIQATAENPLSGLDPLSKGWTIIVGHAQVQLKTLPNIDKRISDIITTTGALTEKNYSKTKLGEKANFNHSLSALVLEFDENSYHLRHLNYDTENKLFWDLNTCYHSDGRIEIGRVEALVTGDEHVLFKDNAVSEFTYSASDSMVNLLKPKYIVRHDVLDAYSISHHHKKNVFTQYAKWKSGWNNIKDELDLTIGYINSTTPNDSISLIIQSNHNEHLLRWLNEVDIKQEPWNALIYHYLMWSMLQQTTMGQSGTEHPDPFEMYAKNYLNDNVEFVNRSGKKILGIEVGSHGDRGINGARGSAASFARIPDKMIVGHSHSPSIFRGCYVVGTSSRLALEYNSGASSWHHAHVIIHSNGKRQMVFITEDGWKL